MQAGTCTAGKAAGVLAEEGQAPLLGLVMIVKNENATLERTLRSIKGAFVCLTSLTLVVVQSCRPTFLGIRYVFWS